MTFRGFLRKALAIAYHAGLTSVALGGIYLVDVILTHTLGKDATLFGFLPVSFLLDAAALGTLLRFVVEVFEEFFK